jgi:hypothetical protein
MDEVHRTLGMFCLYSMFLLPTALPVLIQQLVRDINKSRRAFYFAVLVLPMMAKTTLYR